LRLTPTPRALLAAVTRCHRRPHEGIEAHLITVATRLDVMGTRDRWRSAMALLKVLALAEADVEAGRTVPQAEALRRADAVLKRARRDA
jgi:hypothetical protein